MFMKLVLATVTLVAATASTAARADTLAMDAGKEQQPLRTVSVEAKVPRRGLTMAQVERNFGAPVEKLRPAGGDTPRHPTINRWRYNGFTVYFERNRVIHSVVDAAVVTIPAH